MSRTTCSPVQSHPPVSEDRLVRQPLDLVHDDLYDSVRLSRDKIWSDFDRGDLTCTGLITQLSEKAAFSFKQRAFSFKKRAFSFKKICCSFEKTAIVQDIFGDVWHVEGPTLLKAGRSLEGKRATPRIKSSPVR